MSSTGDKPPFGEYWTEGDEKAWATYCIRRERAEREVLKAPIRRLACLATSGPVEADVLADWLIDHCHEVTKALLPWCARSRQEEPEYPNDPRADRKEGTPR